MSIRSKYDDLISRPAAIDALGEEPEVWNDDDAYMLGERNQWRADRSAIMSLPSAKPRWIPVTERLPNANEKKYGVRRYYLVQNEYSDMMVASWNGVVWEQMYQYRPIEDKVVAWMPLPEPWKGEDDAEVH